MRSWEAGGQPQIGPRTACDLTLYSLAEADVSRSRDGIFSLPDHIGAQCRRDNLQHFADL
jgi:hypothetical protein